MSEEMMREEMENVISKNCSSFTINKTAMVNDLIKIVKKHEKKLENCEAAGIRLPLMISTWNKPKKK